MTTPTKIGMAPVGRPPALTQDRLVRFARVAAPVFAEQGAPHTAAVCEAFLQLIAENAHLRGQLDSIQEWSDQPTRRVDPPDPPGGRGE
jgi:hypothetical protein